MCICYMALKTNTRLFLYQIVSKCYKVFQKCGPSDRSRTCNLRLRRPLLYPIELQTDESGSASRARTYDPVINSHLLYLLSYRGMILYVYFVNCIKDIFETFHKKTASDDMRISSPSFAINIDINLFIDFEFFFSSHSLVPMI